MLILAACAILSVVQCIKTGFGSFYFNIVRLFVAGIIVYVAGRLNRIEQNKYLLGFATLAHLVGSVVLAFNYIGSRSLLSLFTWCGSVISIVVIMIAYLVCYKEHKEADLMDTPKNKDI